jgi:hypothetical protein
MEEQRRLLLTWLSNAHIFKLTAPKIFQLNLLYKISAATSIVARLKVLISVLLKL